MRRVERENLKFRPNSLRNIMWSLANYRRDGPKRFQQRIYWFIRSLQVASKYIILVEKVHKLAQMMASDVMMWKKLVKFQQV